MSYETLEAQIRAISIAILNGLPLAHDIRIVVENFLCGKVQEDVFTKNG